MSQPNKLIVEAFIPSSDDVSAHVVDHRGLSPIETAHIHQDIETILHTIGKKALANGHLSIDHVTRGNHSSHPYGGSSVNKAVITTEPIDRSTINLSKGYTWSDADKQDTLELSTNKNSA
jgi:predicted naringenin-chalcone synthase|tara:strand:- start:975 stop:1334 length:360 start_codon:yes stop_codon:yes gene_type:complete